MQIAAQWPLERKRARATWLVDNRSSQAKLAAGAQVCWRAVTARDQLLPGALVPTRLCWPLALVLGPLLACLLC